MRPRLRVHPRSTIHVYSVPMMFTLKSRFTVPLCAIAVIAIGLLSGHEIAPARFHDGRPPTTHPNAPHFDLSNHAIVVEPETSAILIEPIVPSSTRGDRE